MAGATVVGERLALVHGICKVARTVDGHRRRQLLKGPLLLAPNGGHLGGQRERALDEWDARELGNAAGRLTDDGGVDSQVILDEHIAHLLGVLGREHVHATALELMQKLIVYGVDDDDRLLGGADHAVVESFGEDDGGARHVEVGGLVHEGGRVAGAHAYGGLAGRVAGVNHAWPAGRKRILDLGVVQQLVGDAVLGRARAERCVDDDARRLVGALGGRRVRREDDGVARLECDERLEDERRSRVGDRRKCNDRADGLSNLREAGGDVGLDHANCLESLVLVVHHLRGELVLDDLVLDDPAASVCDSELGEAHPCLGRGESDLVEDVVHLCLREAGEVPVRLLDPLEHSIEVVLTVDGVRVFLPRGGGGGGRQGSGRGGGGVDGGGGGESTRNEA
eukprot:scaffold23177_cov28-Tisochrysis_lutea.AAC.4